VVLPDSTDDFLLLKPLGGLEDDVAGLLPDLEAVEPAQFALPTSDDLGDHRSARLLRDAVRLGFRSSAGPFRSFGRIAVEPRSYQLVPLLMALRLDPVRLLIADDVGIGKTVEALLIAKELLDRGEIQRTAVLCPPHLAEQWQEEMRDKFNVESEVVLSGTVRRLERHCRFNESLFERYPHVVVSLDFIKSDRRRAEFLRSCPEFVVVDEVHTCAGRDGPGRHQRHELVSALSRDPDRHLVLVTATPHSGKEESFTSLLGLLSPRLSLLAAEMGEPSNRRELAAHFVQRRRGDIRRFLEQDTAFPERREREATWALTTDYRHLFERVLAWARETVRDTTGGRHRQRVRWWSALALLRALGSSPAAAAATLRTRAAGDGTLTAEEADEVGMSTVLDLDLGEVSDQGDTVPGALAPGETEDGPDRRMLDLARAADRLRGDHDPKLLGLTAIVADLLGEGFSPIVFCRFIQTAEYVAAELAGRLPSGVTVSAVTGLLPPEEREARVAELAAHPKRVLVCTDCLSEGINLQRAFDAVVHYDLSWNPTRHEQRDGRVDRFGQGSREVRIVTYFGVDNRIDGIVLDVLLRKHREIRRATGVAVPVPGDSSQIIEAIFEGLLLREEQAEDIQEYLPGFEELLRPRREDLHRIWEDASDREVRSRSMFAQDSLKPDDVLPELAATREVLGESKEVREFVVNAVRALGGIAEGVEPLILDLRFFGGICG
jgi:SNF2 family DNA or RNA helicase